MSSPENKPIYLFGVEGTN